MTFGNPSQGSGVSEDSGVGVERVKLVGLGLVFKEPDGRPGREVFEVRLLLLRCYSRA